MKATRQQAKGAGSFKWFSASMKTLSEYALRHNLLSIAYAITRLYFLTIRIESVNEDELVRYLKSGNKAIAAIWHQRIIASVGYADRFAQFEPSVMISASRDGDLIADVYRRMKFRPVRGSSTLHGKEALTAMVGDLRDHAFAVHVLDGPKGPRGVVKPGLIALARKSGVPVVPVYISMSRAWVLKSWDRCLVPKPFSKIVIRWDGPRAVAPEMDERTFEEVRGGIEARMLENQRADDHRFGWTDLI
jgi:hypothetical protein